MRPCCRGRGSSGRRGCARTGRTCSACAFTCCTWAAARPAAAVREQVLARTLGRLDPGTAGPELLRRELRLVEHSAARWGRASSAPRGSACSGRRRPLRSAARRAEPRHVAAGEPPHAAASRASPAAATSAAAVTAAELMAGRAPSAPASRTPSPSSGTAAISCRSRCRRTSSRSPGSRRSGGRVGIGREPVRCACSGRPSSAKASFCWSPGVPRRPRRRGSRCLQTSLAASRRLLRHAESLEPTREVPLRVGVGEVRHAVRAHAARKSERRAHLRRSGRARGREAALRRSRRDAELATLLPATRRRPTASAATAAVATIANEVHTLSMVARPDNSREEPAMKSR